MKYTCFLYDISEECNYCKDIIKILINAEKGDCIEIYINSDGGSLSLTFSIVSLIEKAIIKGIEVKTIGLHDVHSGSALILSSGTKGKRFITEDSLLYIHSPEYEIGLNFLNFNKKKTVMGIEFKQYISFYKKNLNNPTETLIRELLENETILNSQEILYYGFADNLYNKEVIC